MHHRLLRPFQLRRFLHERSLPTPALLHAHHRHVAPVMFELALMVGAPCMVTIQDNFPAAAAMALRHRLLRRIIAVSPTIERQLVVDAQIPQEAVRMIPSGVPLPSHPQFPTLSPATEIPIVGTASALEPDKGLTYFLLAAELILSAGDDVEFCVAGCGPEEELLRRAAQHLDIANRVTFVPHVQDYDEIVQTYDVFVDPSLQPGMGTLMLGAMALAKPVVATRVGGVADFFVDGKTALLVPSANHVILADKIQLLLDDPERARELAIAGQNYVRRQFSVERMVQRTARVYEEVLAGIKAAALPAR